MGTLNRPFAHHCRRCKAELEPGASGAWEEAGREGWSRPLLAAPGEAAEVVDLKDRVGRAVAGTTRVAMAIAQGVLALHEVHPGGGMLALLRPLAEPGTDPWVWRVDDLGSPGKRERPFDPVFLAGGRHVIFARPGRVLAIDLWGCRGLSAWQEARPWVLEVADRPLAAPPVPLDGSTVGLLRRDATGGYRWEVFGLRYGEDGTIGVALGSAELRLLKGDACQLSLIDDRVLAFATREGHWVWAKADAMAHPAETAGKMLPTWVPDEARRDVQIDLDDHVVDRDAFYLPRQGFIVDQPGESMKFEWYYRVVRDVLRANTGGVEQYYVEFTPLRASRARSLDEALGADRDSRPLGPTRAAGALVKMLFKHGDRLRVGNNDGAISKSEIHLPTTLSGLRLFDPLIVVIALDERSKRRHLEVHSLRHQHSPKLVIPDSNGIVSDPLIWGRWLFTAELEDDLGLKVKRRALVPEA